MPSALPTIGAHSPKITKRRQRTRETLIDVAAKAFAERGIDKVSVDEIIDQAGIAKSTFYTFFRSKKDLVGAIIAPVFDGGSAGLEAIASDRLDDVVDGIIEVYLDLWREYADAFLLLSDLDEKYFALVEQEHHRFSQTLHRVIDRPKELDRLRGGSPEYTHQLVARCALPLLKIFSDDNNFDDVFKSAMKDLLLPSNSV